MKKLMLGLVFALAVAVSIGVLSAGAVTSNKAVSVNLNEFNVLPAVQGAPAGKVTFTVKNSGKIEHEFVVLKTLRSAGGLMDKSGEASEAGTRAASIPTSSPFPRKPGAPSCPGSSRPGVSTSSPRRGRKPLRSLAIQVPHSSSISSSNAFRNAAITT